MTCTTFWAVLIWTEIWYEQFFFLSTEATQVHLENWEDTTKHQEEN